MYINRQLSFIINSVFFGFTCIEPFCTTLWQFYLACFLNSLGGPQSWDSGNSVWVVEMWGRHSAPLLNLSQMMYSIGMIIGPLLVKPYLYGDLSNKTGTVPINGSYTTTLPSILSTTTISLNGTSDDDINYSVDRRSELKIPFMIGGGVTLTGKCASSFTTYH